MRVDPAGKATPEVGQLAFGHADHAHGAQPDVADGRRRIVPIVARDGDRDRHDGEDARRTEFDGGPHRDELDDAAIDVVVVCHWMGREDHGHAGGRDRAVEHVDRAGSLARRRGARVCLDDRPVFGHVAHDAGAQCGHGETQLQAGPCHQGRIDGAYALVRAVAQGVGQRVEVEDGAAAGAEPTTHPGEPQRGAGDEAQQVALALAPGPLRLAALVPAGRDPGGGAPSAGRTQHGGGIERERGAGCPR